METIQNRKSKIQNRLTYLHLFVPTYLPTSLEALKCEDFRLREAMIQALAAIGDTRVIPSLLNLLQLGKEQPLEILIEALGTFIDALSHHHPSAAWLQITDHLNPSYFPS